MLVTIWQQFLTIVRQEAGSRVVETWLKAVSLYKWDAIQKIVYLQAPNSFVKEWIKSNYLNLFQTHLARLLNVDSLKVIFVEGDVSILIKEEYKEPESTKIVPAHRVSSVPYGKVTHQPARIVNRYHLNRNYIFDTFVVGPNNQMAYAAACGVVQKLGNLYNPLFIYGGSGLGKTHLLHAIAHEIKIQQATTEVLYQPAERFVNEFIHAIRFNKIHHFQMKYKTVDVLLIDDIQCISNKEQTQEAFFHIFNTLHDAHKQIVFSSDSYPANIEGLAERLKSRLAWGLVTDIQVPSLETKIAILKEKAELNDEQLPDDVATFIASLVISNIRELEGALIRISAYASLTKQPITLELAKKVLLKSKEGKQITVDFDRVIKTVSNHFSYNLHDLRSKNRSKQLVLARQVAMYFMKKMTTKSLQEIAHYLGRSDHSTVIHALNQIAERMAGDHKFGDHLNQIHQEILG